MNKCEYYKVKNKSIKPTNMRISQQAGPSRVVEIWYCNNYLSESEGLSFEKLSITVGGANRLNCGGDINKCQLKQIP